MRVSTVNTFVASLVRAISEDFDSPGQAQAEDVCATYFDILACDLTAAEREEVCRQVVEHFAPVEA